MAPVRPADPRPEPSWSGWGDPAAPAVLPEPVVRMLADGLGVRGGSQAPGSIAEMALPERRLSDDVIDELAAIVGPDQVLSDDEARVRHLRGKSMLDLLRIRTRDGSGAADVVLLPGSHDEVLSLLRLCSERRVAVVPFGGGTSVVGGLEPVGAGFFAGVVALDVRRLNALLSIDEVSRLAEFEPGLRGPEAEALLRKRGYTIGHFPQSFEYGTVGGFAAARSSGQASAGYGRFDELVLALRVATPAGTLEVGRAPRSAAGPDLRQLILGSEGTFGVITSLSLTIRPAPLARTYEGWRFESFADGIAVLRALAQDGPLPTVLRLSDEAETAINLTRPAGLGSGSGGCLAIVGYEGRAPEVSARRDAVAAVLGAAGAELVPGAGDGWEHERYRGPYLRDALLDAGALVETLETATWWSSLESLYGAVSGALRESLAASGTPPMILCHVSHVYPAGASLYFTVVCAQSSDPVGQWRAAKASASDAILDAGGTITHHHGVGVDHREWYEREVGALGVRALRAMKAALDPAGIMNPGVLLPR